MFGKVMKNFSSKKSGEPWLWKLNKSLQKWQAMWSVSRLLGEKSQSSLLLKIGDTYQQTKSAMMKIYAKNVWLRFLKIKMICHYYQSFVIEFSEVQSSTAKHN